MPSCSLGGAAAERGAKRIDESIGAAQIARAPEDVEIRALQHDADAVLGEPPRVGSRDVFERRSAADVGADAAERREVGGAVRRQASDGIALGGEEREAAADDVVESALGLATSHDALQKEMPRERIPGDADAGTERGPR
jgi:hypothetical protein